jgi:hypothetical protein
MVKEISMVTLRCGEDVMWGERIQELTRRSGLVWQLSSTVAQTNPMIRDLLVSSCAKIQTFA